MRAGGRKVLSFFFLPVSRVQAVNLIPSYRFLDDAWETLRLHTEMSALGHLESAQQFADEAAFIAETSVKFREERKTHEERVR